MTSPILAHQVLLRRAVPALRVELADAATRGRVVTPADAAAVIAGVSTDALPVDAVLDALTRACVERDEPDLASLVVRDAGRPTGHLDTERLHTERRHTERRRCWRHWGGAGAETAGLALTPR